jgi:hypothetical protein
LSSMIVFHVPEDKELLAAYGELAIVHEHLKHILRMTIKSLAQVSVDDALDATKNDSSSQLRDRIKKLGRQKLGEGVALIRLQAILARCKCATDKRNELIHSICAKEIDGKPHMQGDRTRKPLPTVSELKDLINKLSSLTQELNEARLEGFLLEALKQQAK